MSRLDTRTIPDINEASRISQRRRAAAQAELERQRNAPGFLRRVALGLIDTPTFGDAISRDINEGTVEEFAIKQLALQTENLLLLVPRFISKDVLGLGDIPSVVEEIVGGARGGSTSRDTGGSVKDLTDEQLDFILAGIPDKVLIRELRRFNGVNGLRAEADRIRVKMAFQEQLSSGSFVEGFVGGLASQVIDPISIIVDFGVSLVPGGVSGVVARRLRQAGLAVRASVEARRFGRVLTPVLERVAGGAPRVATRLDDIADPVLRGRRAAETAEALVAVNGRARRIGVARAAAEAGASNAIVQSILETREAEFDSEDVLEQLAVGVVLGGAFNIGLRAVSEPVQFVGAVNNHLQRVAHIADVTVGVRQALKRKKPNVTPREVAEAVREAVGDDTISPDDFERVLIANGLVDPDDVQHLAAVRSEIGDEPVSIAELIAAAKTVRERELSGRVDTANDPGIQNPRVYTDVGPDDLLGTEAGIGRPETAGVERPSVREDVGPDDLAGTDAGVGKAVGDEPVSVESRRTDPVFRVDANAPLSPDEFDIVRRLMNSRVESGKSVTRVAPEEFEQVIIQSGLIDESDAEGLLKAKKALGDEPVGIVKIVKVASDVATGRRGNISPTARVEPGTDGQRLDSNVSLTFDEFNVLARLVKTRNERGETVAKVAPEDFEKLIIESGLIGADDAEGLLKARIALGDEPVGLAAIVRAASDVASERRGNVGPADLADTTIRVDMGTGREQFGPDIQARANKPDDDGRPPRPRGPSPRELLRARMNSGEPVPDPGSGPPPTKQQLREREREAEIKATVLGMANDLARTFILLHPTGFTPTDSVGTATGVRRFFSLAALTGRVKDDKTRAILNFIVTDPVVRRTKDGITMVGATASMANSVGSQMSAAGQFIEAALNEAMFATFGVKNRRQLAKAVGISGNVYKDVAAEISRRATRILRGEPTVAAGSVNLNDPLQVIGLLREVEGFSEASLDKGAKILADRMRELFDANLVSAAYANVPGSRPTLFNSLDDVDVRDIDPKVERTVIGIMRDLGGISEEDAAKLVRAHLGPRGSAGRKFVPAQFSQKGLLDTIGRLMVEGNGRTQEQAEEEVVRLIADMLRVGMGVRANLSPQAQELMLNKMARRILKANLAGGDFNAFQTSMILNGSRPDAVRAIQEAGLSLDDPNVREVLFAIFGGTEGSTDARRATAGGPFESRLDMSRSMVRVLDDGTTLSAFDILEQDIRVMAMRNSQQVAALTSMEQVLAAARGLFPGKRINDYDDLRAVLISRMNKSGDGKLAAKLFGPPGGAGLISSVLGTRGEVDDAVRMMYGIPVIKSATTRRVLRIIGNANVTRLMGRLLFSIPPDAVQPIVTNGMRQMLAASPDFVRILQNLRSGKGMSSETQAIIAAISRIYRPVGNMAISDNGDITLGRASGGLLGALELASARAADAVTGFTGAGMVDSTIRVANAVSSAHRFINAVLGEGKPVNDSIMRRMGFTTRKEMAEFGVLLREEIESGGLQIVRDPRTKKIIDFDIDSQMAKNIETLQRMIGGVQTLADSNLQPNTDLGATRAFMRTPAGRILGQFGVFSIINQERGVMARLTDFSRDRAIGGLFSMGVGALTYVLSVYQQSIRIADDEERKKFIDQRLSTRLIAINAFTRSNFSGIVPRAGGAIFGDEFLGLYRNSGVVASPFTLDGTPTVQGAGALANTIRELLGVPFGDPLSDSDVRRAFSLLPFQNTLLGDVVMRMIAEGTDLPENDSDER